MNIPKVKSAKAYNDHILVVEFDNNQKKTYDVSPLLKNELFSPLKNLAFFKNVKVEKRGYAVYWNREIDISEYELWKHGNLIS